MLLSTFSHSHNLCKNISVSGGTFLNYLSNTPDVFPSHHLSVTRYLFFATNTILFVSPYKFK